MESAHVAFLLIGACLGTCSMLIAAFVCEISDSLKEIAAELKKLNEK